MVGSEATLAQPANKLITVPRTISLGFQHLTKGIIASFGGLKSLGDAAEFFAAAPCTGHEEENGGESQPGQGPPPQRGEEGDHRRPRFQSSIRA